MTVRVVRGLVLAVAGSVAALGALAGSTVHLVWLVPVSAGVTAAVTALVNPAFPVEPAARRLAVYAGATGAVAVPFIMGLAILGGDGGVVVLIMLLGVVGVLGAMRWLIGLEDEAASRRSESDVAWISDMVSVLPSATLLVEWRRCGAILTARAGTEADRAHAVQMRALILDELLRRDPEAGDRLSESDGGSAGNRRDLAG